MELMEGRVFVHKFLVFCLYWIEFVQWYVNDSNYCPKSLKTLFKRQSIFIAEL